MTTNIKTFNPYAIYEDIYGYDSLDVIPSITYDIC